MSDIETFAFPDDFVPTAVPSGADGAVLGATPVPGGAELFGGVGLDVWDAANGDVYVIVCGERGEGRKFGTYCLRYPRGSSRGEWVELPGFTEGRAGVAERPDGLFVAWQEPGGKSWSRHRVPGYQTPGFPTNGLPARAGPVSITTTPPAGSLTDGEARAQVRELQKQVKALQKQVAELTTRPAAAPLTGQQLADALWAALTSGKGEDWLYGLLARNTGGVVGQVQRLAAETAKAMKAKGEI